jgi:hypothetical protein
MELPNTNLDYESSIGAELFVPINKNTKISDITPNVLVRPQVSWVSKQHKPAFSIIRKSSMINPLIVLYK